MTYLRIYTNFYYTECVTDLDKRSELLIFELILTTFKLSIVLKAAGAEV